MVKIRLQRHGRKRLPYYHIVVADSRARRDGRIIEDLGRYSPTEQPVMVKLDTARVVHWINKGAQPTDTVRSILKKEGIMLRMHLMRWGKTEDEIETAVAEFKTARAGKTDKSVASSSSTAERKARLKKEEEAFVKAQAAARAEAEKKAAEQAAAKAEAEKKAAEEAAAAEAEAQKAAAESEAPAEEAAPVAEEAAAEEAPAEAPAEDAAAEEAPAEEPATPADDAPAAEEEDKKDA